MKKTIIALLALAGVASADYTGTFKWEADTQPLFTFADTSDIVLIVEDMYIAEPGGALTKAPFDSTDPKGVSIGDVTSVTTKPLTPATNVGNGGSWNVTFSIINSSAETLTLNGITFDAFAYNNQGGAQSADFLTRKITFALTGAATASVDHSFTNIDTDEDGRTSGGDVFNWNSNPALTFKTPVEIAADDYARFTLTVSESDSQGCFIGLTGVTLNTPAVPEPTTATLSLLALAGLAARRRRK